MSSVISAGGRGGGEEGDTKIAVARFSVNWADHVTLWQCILIIICCGIGEMSVKKS